MPKPMLKKVHFFLFAVTCLVTVAIYSCKKDSRTGQQNTISDPAIAQGKNWYESTYPASNAKIATQAAGTSTAFSQLISPDWQHAASYNREGQRYWRYLSILRLNSRLY